LSASCLLSAHAEYTQRKAAEKAAREQKRQEKRQEKLSKLRKNQELRELQKQAALQRAAAAVQSDRIPLEITQGAAAVSAVTESVSLPASFEASVSSHKTSGECPRKKTRSSITVSTASELDLIVTHSNNLWAKYNAIAKANDQKVSWKLVSKELGIGLKVREKYTRMHSRAMARGFDFVNCGHYRIRDWPQFFTDPYGPGKEAALKANATSSPDGKHDMTAAPSAFVSSAKKT